MNRLIPEDILGILPWRGVDLGADILVPRQPAGLLLNASAARLRVVRCLVRALVVRHGETIKARRLGHRFGCEFIMPGPLGNRS